MASKPLESTALPSAIPPIARTDFLHEQRTGQEVERRLTNDGPKELLEIVLEHYESKNLGTDKRRFSPS